MSARNASLSRRRYRKWDGNLHTDIWRAYHARLAQLRRIQRLQDAVTKRQSSRPACRWKSSNSSAGSSRRLPPPFKSKILLLNRRPADFSPSPDRLSPQKKPEWFFREPVAIPVAKSAPLSRDFSRLPLREISIKSHGKRSSIFHQRAEREDECQAKKRGQRSIAREIA